MFKLVLGAFLGQFCAISVVAMPAALDVDGDGLASLDELAAFYPDFTEQLFAEIDTNDDGFVTDEELLTAIGVGLVSFPENNF